MGLVDELRPRRSRCPHPLHSQGPSPAEPPASGRRTARRRVERGLLPVEAREHEPATHQFRADDHVRVRAPPRDLARALDRERLELRLHEDVADTRRREDAEQWRARAVRPAERPGPRLECIRPEAVRRRPAGPRYPRGCPRVRHRSVTRAGRSRRSRPVRRRGARPGTGRPGRPTRGTRDRSARPRPRTARTRRLPGCWCPSEGGHGSRPGTG